jgi:broad-specificity NMP kinase
MKRFLIVGRSGAGKTAIGRELERRGFRVIHTDRVWGYWGKRGSGDPVTFPGLGVTDAAWYREHAWLWKADIVAGVLGTTRGRTTFFCGSAENVERFLDQFDLVFALTVRPEQLRQRLVARKRHHTSEPAWMERVLCAGSGPGVGPAAPGAIVVDTTWRSSVQSADEILRFVDESRWEQLWRGILRLTGVARLKRWLGRFRRAASAWTRRKPC